MAHVNTKQVKEMSNIEHKNRKLPQEVTQKLNMKQQVFQIKKNIKIKVFKS